MKLKALAAAIALAAVGTTAEASPIPTDGLFISIADQADGTSFLGNLGVTSGDFLANHVNSSFVASGDVIDDLSNWLAPKTDFSQITWNILGTTGGYTATTTGGLTTVSQINPLGTDTRANPINSAAAAIGTFVGVPNSRPEELGSSDGVVYNPIYFIQDFGNVSIGIDSNTLFGEGPLPFYQVIKGTRTTQGQINPLGGSWSFTFDDQANRASVVYAAAPVPVPAAAWLLGSALLGMAGISRRKK